MNKCLNKQELSILAEIANQWLRDKRAAWKYLDGLYNECFYLEGQLARHHYQSGHLNKTELEEIYNEIDDRAWNYDQRVMDQRWLAGEIETIVRALRQHRKEL